MSEDVAYLANYRSNHLYVHPGPAGTYASLASEGEEVLGEIDVTERSKIAVSAFYVNDKADFGTLKITKLKFNKTHGWTEDGHIRINHFQGAKINQFLSIISQLDLSNASKARISLEDISLGSIDALLNSTRGPEIIEKIALSPELHTDIYALGAKRAAIKKFQDMLKTAENEADWQSFFEANPWIFGHGLNYVFLDRVADKLETTTTGSAFDQPGKRVDALLRTRAEISQYVLVEIKRHDTPLLKAGKPYRAGCWGVSDEVSNAVTQIQKTVFDFGRARFHERLRDSDGNALREAVYSVEPRSYLVIGNLAELSGNDDKVTCFELYRRNVRAPEIVTFDELFHRARFIVENLHSDVGTV